MNARPFAHPPILTLAEARARARERLTVVSASAHIDAESLLCHAAQLDRAALITRAHEAFHPTVAAHFWQLIERRASGEPIAYLTGEREFWSLAFRVTPDVLIPRPETELLVEQTLAIVPPDRPIRIADLGTGAGVIAIALSHERPHARLVAVDICPRALAVARENAAQYGLTGVEFRQGDWFAPLAGDQFDIIVSNPPYIADSDPHLTRGDVRFEPRRALVAGGEGLDSIRHIAGTACDYLRPGGALLFEHGFDQADAAAAMLETCGYVDIICHRDLAGRPRVTACRAPDHKAKA